MAQNYAYMAVMEQDLMKTGFPFKKMHGLGNDFVVIDARGEANPVTAELARAVGDRHLGVGFDQLAVLMETPDADVALQFWNADGSLSATCGNATRCVAGLIFAETGAERITIKTERGLLACENAGGGIYRVNLGPPQFDWNDVPLAHEMDTLCLPIEGAPSALGVGNPHCVFFVKDAEAVDIARQGPLIEHHPLYPERTNVEFVEIRAHDEIRLRIWERGTGVTMSSGSCSSASVVAAARRGLSDRKCRVVLDGGVLEIDWREDGVWLSGPTAHVFDGVFTPAFLEQLP